MLAPSFTFTRTRLHPLAQVVVLAVAMMLAVATTAAAQTGFRADVTATVPKPQPCADGAFFCGTANITGYGSANWSFTLTALTQEGTCASYSADVRFVLADGSTLALSENGSACGPGASNLSHASANSYGHPGTADGAWTVDSATGQFTGTAGGGTDTVRFAGAHAAGSYSANP